MFAYSSAGISHVVNQNGNLVLNIANQDHATNDIGARSLLVDQRKPDIQTISDGGCSLGTTSVRRHDDAVL